MKIANAIRQLADFGHAPVCDNEYFYDALRTNGPIELLDLVSTLVSNVFEVL